jgi:hypothetical protein
MIRERFVDLGGFAQAGLCRGGRLPSRCEFAERRFDLGIQFVEATDELFVASIQVLKRFARR